MIERVWILVFMFHGNPVTSGPHDLETCLMMASSVATPAGAHCWNLKTRKRISASPVEAKGGEGK